MQNGRNRIANGRAARGAGRTRGALTSTPPTPVKAPGPAKAPAPVKAHAPVKAPRGRGSTFSGATALTSPALTPSFPATIFAAPAFPADVLLAAPLGAVIVSVTQAPATPAQTRARPPKPAAKRKRRPAKAAPKPRAARNPVKAPATPAALPLPPREELLVAAPASSEAAQPAPQPAASITATLPPHPALRTRATAPLSPASPGPGPLPRNRALAKPAGGLATAIGNWLRSAASLLTLGLVPQRAPSRRRHEPRHWADLQPAQAPTQSTRGPVANVTELSLLRAENRQLRARLDAMAAVLEAQITKMPAG